MARVRDSRHEMLAAMRSRGREGAQLCAQELLRRVVSFELAAEAGASGGAAGAARA